MSLFLYLGRYLCVLENHSSATIYANKVIISIYIPLPYIKRFINNEPGVFFDTF